MAGTRAQKLSSAIQIELSDLIGREVKDPRVRDAGLLTVTEVRLNKDNKVADVMVSFVGAEPAKAKAAMTALEKVAGWLRGEIGRRLGMQFAPELRFTQDRGGEYRAQIDALLKGDKEPE